MLAATGLALWTADGTIVWLVVGTTVVYLVGVQLPTVTINIPRNNRLQSLRTAEMSAENLRDERIFFEATWNRWNVIRTWIAVSTALSLMITLVMM